MNGTSEYKIRNEVVLLSSDGLQWLSAGALSVEAIGGKAFGLLQLPEAWVPQFFCVSSDAAVSEALLVEAGKYVGLAESDAVLVRSSGTSEGIEERGMLVSEATSLSGAAALISTLRSHATIVAAGSRQAVHFIVQRKLKTLAKGHLSNERRVSRYSRDWVGTIEPGNGYEEERGPVAVRKWRNSGVLNQPLICQLRANVFRTLREPGAWGAGRRLHMEWVWDGSNIWIVQCEEANRKVGVIPRTLVKSPHSLRSDEIDSLNHFVVVGEDDYKRYRKLKNAQLYRGLGYKLPDFLLLSDSSVLGRIKDEGKVPETLLEDLEKICKAPLILRTDGRMIPDDKRHMLPRSDELRSVDAAEAWLLGDFVEKLGELHPASCEIVLIGHHFVPAIASAWALAEPSKRRVRIEALWGIPEGIYYFPHDVFDVDVTSLRSDPKDIASVKDPNERIRYKDSFIAPDENGAWVVHEVAPPADYAPSISKVSWTKEVAHATRLIAEKEGRPTVVMWFIGLSGADPESQVLPWFHDRWDVEIGTSSLGKVGKIGKTFKIRKEVDLATLDSSTDTSIGRIAIEPEDGAIVRDPNFIERLAEIAKDRGYVVELRGGVLSHVFYTLKRQGCDVLCVDAFGTSEEKIEFNKIVRDQIPGVIIGHGESVNTAIVKGEALLKGLRHKLVEEALEVADAKDADSITEELADLLEVVAAIESTVGITRREVEHVRAKKALTKGAFKDGVVLLETRLDPPMKGTMFNDELDAISVTGARIITGVPEPARQINVDKRMQDGLAERLLTFNIPVIQTEYKVSRQNFDLETVDGTAHALRFETEISRKGPELRIRFRLVNQPTQLSLFGNEVAVTNDEGKAQQGE